MNRINTVKLHRLILSLKKEEKRFFKLFTKKQNDKQDSFYLQIFDYLDKAEAVDREHFKQKFQAVKGLSGLQSYLYKLILKSLRNQPAYQDIDVTLREGLADLSILYKKELMTEVQETLEELLKLAEAHHKVFFLPSLYEWWFVLEVSHFQCHTISSAQLAQQTANYKGSIDNLKAYQRYRTALADGLILIKERPKELQQELTNLVENLPVYQSNPKGVRLSVRVQELQVRRILTTMLVDNKSAYTYATALSSLLKQQPKEIFETYEGFYYGALISQMSYAPTVEQLSIIIEEIEQGMLRKTKYFDQQFSMSIFINKIDVYLLKGDFEVFERYVKENEQTVTFLTNSGTQYVRNFWYIRLMIYYFAAKEYTQALDIYERFLAKKEVSMVLRKPSLYLEIVIHYEKKAYVLLASILKNTTRLLRKNNALLYPERKLLSLMAKLINLPETEHRPLLVQAKKELVADLATLEDSQKDFFTYFNYIGWIDSQITKAPFEQLFFRHTGAVAVG